MSLRVRSSLNRPTRPPEENSNAAALRTRRVALPNGRALTGGFLVAVAGFGTFVASRAAAPVGRSYVVTSQPIASGQRITASELLTERMVLPALLAKHQAFHSVTAVVGSIAAGPLGSGELVQRSNTIRPADFSASRQIAFSLPTARALDGALVPGDRVDVLATYGSGPAAATVPVLQSAAVVTASTATGLGANGNTSVTLAVASPKALAALVEALNAAQVYLVRSTGTTPGKYPNPYQAPAGA